MQGFRALRLNPEEQAGVLPFITQPGGVPLHTIPDWVKKRFETYSLLKRTLHQTAKDYAASTNWGLPPPRTNNAMGQVEDGKRRGRKKRGNYSPYVLGAVAGLGEHGGNKKTPGDKPPFKQDLNMPPRPGLKPPHCGYCKSTNKDPNHW